MYRKFLIAALALTLSPLAFAAQSAKAAKAPTVQAFSNVVDADGLKNIKLTVAVGKVKITTNSSDKVVIKTVATAGENVHFIFDWTTGKSARALPPGLHLVTHRDGDTLVVSLKSDDSSSGNDNMVVNPFNGTVTVHGHSHPAWKSNWTVSLPARLALNLTVGVGKANVLGLTGGVNAKIGLGKLDAQLPSGPIDAKVGVGHLTANVLSDDYGKVSLSAGEGRVEFDVHGERNASGYTKTFTSAKQSLTGSGKTAYSLTAGVGHVELKLGVKKLAAPGSDNMDPDDLR